MQVDYYTYKLQTFTCAECGWQGNGSELQHGYFSEEHLIGDLECPVCSHVVAFWQAPLKDESKN